MNRLAMLFLLAASVANAEVRVIDGDTLKVDGIKFRLAGINCPESDDVQGDAATAYAQFLVDQGGIHCERTDGTSHDRLVGRCYVKGNIDMGMALILHGDCGRCPRYDVEGRYATAQEEGGFSGRFPKYCKAKK